MKYLKIKNTDMEVSEIALGMMRIYQMKLEDVEALVEKALELGINFFDHADIYGGGICEKKFGELLAKHPDWRSKMYLQSKCGIRQGMYDFSKEHIINSVNNSLVNLQCDYLDVLLLHRPDALMDPKVVAEAFEELYNSKKVRYFGVSNFNSHQIALLQKFTKVPLVFNQLQFNVVNSGMIDCGINANMSNALSIDHDGHVLDYCRLHDITIQPWSILQASWADGCFINNEKFPSLNNKLSELATKYQVTPAALSVAWILRHPAKMQPIAGTTSIEHLTQICEAVNIELSAQDWYALYLSNEKVLP